MLIILKPFNNANVGFFFANLFPGNLRKLTGNKICHSEPGQDNTQMEDKIDWLKWVVEASIEERTFGVQYIARLQLLLFVN